MMSQKGVALILALVAVMLMSFLAAQIGSRAALEHEAGQLTYENLRAYHLAKVGVELSRLRIYIFRKVVARFGGEKGAPMADFDMIWSLPFAWPPQALPGASSFEQEALDDAVKKSLIEGAFVASIEGEGGKIDLNDLGSPSEGLRKSTWQQLYALLQDRFNGDDDDAREMRNTIKPEEVINNIADYVDEDSDSLNGGSEDGPYKGDVKPANRSLKTVEELHLIPGVTDAIYKILAPRITVYGVKGINVNLAKDQVLKSIDPQLKDDVVKAIIERRNDPLKGGPFKDENDFVAFVGTQGVNTQTFNKEHPVPLLFDSEYNFRIKSFGKFRRAEREIVAIVYDFGKVKVQLEKLTAASPTPTPGQAAGTGGATSGQTTGQAAPTPTPSQEKDSGPTGPPTIVFWQES